MFGSHLSVAGGMHNALIAARDLRMDCVQVFTKNQRQWKAPPLAPAAVADWLAHRRATMTGPVVSHDSYLINLASPGEEILQKSLDAFRDEIQRCETLGIPFLVSHPGAHMGRGVDAGIARLAKSLDEIHRDLRGYATITCLEITAGQGTTLGFELEQLRRMIDSVAEPERLGVCIDTAHALEAGYDLTAAAGARGFVQQVEATLGLGRVRVLHVNDSKTPRGSRVDRHEHIGHGHIPLEAFGVIVNEPAWRDVPKILETPKEKDAEGRDWDAVNVEVLRGLVGQ